MPHTKKPMNKRKIIVLILGISLIISCKQKENSQISEIETWKLGWRMIENSMEDNYEIANLQFDSLRNITNKIDRKYLLTGLKSKNEIGKNEEIIQILSNYAQFLPHCNIIVPKIRIYQLLYMIILKMLILFLFEISCENIF